MRIGCILPLISPDALTVGATARSVEGVDRRRPRGPAPPRPGGQAPLQPWPRERRMGAVGEGRITVFLADDNVIVREGVRALLGLEADLDVVGTADDYDSL